MPTDDLDLVMPILVPLNTGSTHAGVLADVADAAARAVLCLCGGSQLLAGSHIDLKDWWESGMRKSVRRTRPAAFAKALLPGSEESRLAVVLGPRAYVGTLKPYPEFSRFERRAQVSGWNLSADHVTGPLPGDQDAIVVPASLSTGKAAAAAAHVVTQLVLGADEAQRAAWRTPIVHVVEEVFPQRCHFVIRDAGHTEVEPGTVTAGFVART